MVKMVKRIIAVVLSAVMLFAFAPTTAFAVTGDQIAADGTYTSTLQGYKKGEKKSDYTATLNVVVSNGKITSMSLSNVKEDKMTKAFNASGYQYYLNNDASISVVDAIDIDAVSGATTSANAAKNAKYSINLAEALKTALGTAPSSGNTSSGEIESSQSDEVKTAPLYGYKDKELKYTATLNVGIKDGKIQNIWLSDYSSDKMQTSLAAAKYSQFLGLDASPSAIKSLTDVDAVSSATSKSVGLTSSANTEYSISLIDSLIMALSDGEQYTADVKGQKVKKSKVDKTYSATLNAIVDDGKILGIWLTGYSDEDMVKKVFADTGYTAFIGIDATTAAVNTAAATSTVKDAEAKSELSTSSKYSMNLVEALLEIVGQVPIVELETFYTGSATADNGKYSLEVVVGLRDGNVSSIKIGDNTSSNGNWASVLSNVQNNLVGKSKTNAQALSVDAVSSATRYTGTFYSAVSKALGYNIDMSKMLAADPVFTWANDYSSATANVTYKNGDTESVSANVTSSVTKSVGCETTGIKEYTATVSVQTTNGNVTYSDIKTEVIPAVGHTYGVPAWDWTDKTAPKAIFTCTLCGDEQSVGASSVMSVKNAATLKTDYTATVSFNGTEYTDTYSVREESSVFAQGKIDSAKIILETYFAIPEGDNAANYTLEFNGTAKSLSEYESVNMKVDGTNTETLYKISVTAPAKNMTTAYPYVLKKDGVTVKENTTSIRTYADIVLANENTTAQQKAICNAMLTYGAAAQEFFGYETTNLANDGITGEGCDYSDVVIPEPTVLDSAALNKRLEEDSAPIRYYGMNLSLKSDTILMLAFKVTGDDKEAAKTYMIEHIKLGGKTVTPVENGNYLVISTDNIPIKSLLQDHMISVDGVDITSANVGQYLYRKSSNASSDIKLANVCKALYSYYLWATEQKRKQ